MEMRGLMGGLYRIMEWIMRLSVINVLWIVLSFPFFFLLLSLYTSPDLTVEMIRPSLLMLGVVSIFTLIPATAAMLSVARKWVMGDGDVPLFRTFFKGYKENYKYSMFGGFVFLALAVIFYVNYTFYTGRSGWMSFLSYLFIILLVFLAGAFFNFLSIMVHFHMKFWQIVKNSLLLSIGNPIITILILLSNAGILYIAFQKSLTFMIPFFMGSLMAYITFWFFYSGFNRMQSKLESMQNKQEEENAEEGEENSKEIELIEENSSDDLREAEKKK